MELWLKSTRYLQEQSRLTGPADSTDRDDASLWPRDEASHFTFQLQQDHFTTSERACMVEGRGVSESAPEMTRRRGEVQRLAVGQQRGGIANASTLIDSHISDGSINALDGFSRLPKSLLDAGETFRREDTKELFVRRELLLEIRPEECHEP
jgi:hypothetical protein